MFQEQMIFFPEPLDEETDLSWTSATEEVFVDTDDGARIHGLFFEASEDADRVVLYFHGNAGSVASWHQVGKQICDHGLDVLLMDYRTYGKSTGKMSEQGLHLDGKASREHLLERGYDPESIVVYGRSLGTTVATWLATEFSVEAMVLETPFVNLEELAAAMYGMSLPDWFLKYRFPNAERAKQIEAPTWVVHGTDDEIVPLEHAERIYETLPRGWDFTVIDGGGHNNLMSFPTYDEKLQEFLDATDADPQ